MSYAFRKDKQGFRAVDSSDDITPDEDYCTELPVIEPPEIPFATPKTAELDKFRSDRDLLLNRVAGIALFATVPGNIDALKVFRQGLLDLPAFPTVTAATDIVALKAAMKAQYDALVAPLPVDLKIAFIRSGQ